MPIIYTCEQAKYALKIMVNITNNKGVFLLTLLVCKMQYSLQCTPLSYSIKHVKM